jgi:hypothetical protein
MDIVADEEEGIRLSFKLDLFSIGMITLPDQTIVEPQIQFKHELGMVVVDETLAMEKVKTFHIAEGTLSQDIHVRKITWGQY